MYLAFFQQIRWENRLREDKGRTCKINVDGADFRIQQPTQFDTKWYSHKFNGPAVRYELASCIQTGDIVWMNGPFCPGNYNDIQIFRDKLKDKLLRAGEKAEADKGYRGELGTIRHPGVYISLADRKAKKSSRARHETLNRRMKQFGCLQQTYRHDLKKHLMIFRAVATITQMSFDVGEKPYQVKY